MYCRSRCPALSTCPYCDQISAHVLGSFGHQEKSAVHNQKLRLVNYKQFHSSQFVLCNTYDMSGMFLCWQGHQEVPHTQGTIIIKDAATRLEQRTVHLANRRLLDITNEKTHTACSRIQAVLILVRIQQIPSSSSSEGSTNTNPGIDWQREFNKHHPRITVEDSTKAVQVLPVRTQQE